MSSGIYVIKEEGGPKEEWTPSKLAVTVKVADLPEMKAVVKFMRDQLLGVRLIAEEMAEEVTGILILNAAGNVESVARRVQHLAELIEHLRDAGR